MEFRDLERIKGTIVEHRADGTNRFGRIEYSGSAGYGAVGIGWSDGFNRTTCFDERSWSGQEIDGVVFLRRTAADKRETDAPLTDVNMYTIILER